MQEDSQKRKVTIGSVLIDARSQARLSQTEVARQMNLTVGTIQALEEDDFDSLPGPTYVRGYLHTYSKLVGLDDGQLIRIYNEQCPVEPEHRPVVRANSKRGPVVLLTGAVLVVLAGAYLLLQTLGPQPSVRVAGLAGAPEVPAATPQGSVKLPEAPVAGPEETPDASVDSGISVPLLLGKLQNQDMPAARVDDHGPTSPPVEASVPVSDGRPAPDENLEVLKLTFMDDSWAEVRDADMQLLMWDLVRSGAVLEIKGKAPFEVLLGNSPDVVIHIAGKRFDHSGFHQSNRTSRFKVPGGLLN